MDQSNFEPYVLARAKFALSTIATATVVIDKIHTEAEARVGICDNIV